MYMDTVVRKSDYTASFLNKKFTWDKNNKLEDIGVGAQSCNPDIGFDAYFCLFSHTDQLHCQ